MIQPAGIAPRTLVARAERLEAQAARAEDLGDYCAFARESIGTIAGGGGLLLGLGTAVLGAIVGDIGTAVGAGLAAGAAFMIAGFASAPLLTHLTHTAEARSEKLFDRAFELRDQARGPVVEILPPEKTRASAPTVIEGEWTVIQ